MDSQIRVILIGASAIIMAVSLPYFSRSVQRAAVRGPFDARLGVP